MKKSVKLLTILLLPATVLAQATLERRQQYLKDILKINIPQSIHSNTLRVTLKDSTWMDWLKRTGELPPDFSQMRSTPNLPEPLMLTKNGLDIPITTAAQWTEKCQWIKDQYQQWISGRFPPVPKSFKTTILSDRTERGTRIQMVRINFGPDNKATITMEIMIPAGKGPMPVYMTQWTHRDWAQLAVRRGYIGCVYAAADNKDDTEAYMALYPNYDFCMLMRRAWGASRVVDYLYTRPEVNKTQIAITGHSRNGKQSLWAAAFDDRITAVISSSSGTGGDSPWRYGDPQYASETIDLVTAFNGHWFNPRLRFFFGREDRLPVDQNLLAALIAPRALLYHYSIVEHGLNSWAVEQNYHSVKKVYNFMHAPDNIGILTRMGEHAVAARDVEKSIDFLDIHFNRRKMIWHNQFYFPYDQPTWQKEHPVNQAEAKKVTALYLKEKYQNVTEFGHDCKMILQKLRWLLGDEPSGVKATDVAETDFTRHDWIDNTIGRPILKDAKAIYLGPYTAMGDHLAGILYCPTDAAGKIKLPVKGKLPVVIYLHQYAYSTGYASGYDKTNGNGNQILFQELVKKGFAVLAIDMFGFGTRIEEATNFYERFPNWSKMGKMVNDVRGCVDAIEGLDYIDSKNIFLLGNTIGGSVGLVSAALDDRIAATAVVAAASPWRTSNRQYETLKTYTQLHGFIPRLGFFDARPQQIPVDFAEIISTIAPRPFMLIAPDMDRHTDLPALKKSLKPLNNVYGLYGAQDKLNLSYPHEINRLSAEMTIDIINFYLKALNKK